MYRLYGMLESGNCYKVRLLLAQLDLPFEWVEVDILAGESRTRDFLRKNPNGRIPLLEIDADTALPESNAILYYLAADSAFMPAGRLTRARVLQWMFFEQYSHEPYIATSRYIRHLLGSPPQRRAELESKQAPGYAALGVMEGHLHEETYFAGGAYSIADTALYAYTHVAGEGGFDLARFPAVRAWIHRVEAQPRYVPMRAPL